MTSNIDIDEKQVETLESVPINFLLQTMCLSTYLFLNPLKVVCLLCHNVLNFFLSVFALCVHLLVHFVQQFFDFNLLHILFTCSRIFSPLSQATSSTSHGILPALLRVRLPEGKFPGICPRRLRSHLAPGVWTRGGRSHSCTFKWYIKSDEFGVAAHSWTMRHGWRNGLSNLVFGLWLITRPWLGARFGRFAYGTILSMKWSLWTTLELGASLFLIATKIFWSKGKTCKKVYKIIWSFVEWTTVEWRAVEVEWSEVEWSEVEWSRVE